MFKFYLLLFIMLLTSSVFGLQVKAVGDNETVAAKISSLDVTRILVKGDRIKNVKGLKGAYTRENDETNGEVYIQPTSLFQDRAFTLLLETEQGKHFTLLLNPIAVPSDTLMLVPRNMKGQAVTQFKHAFDYKLTLVHLIRDLSNDLVPEGYAVRQIETDKKYSVNNQATLKLKSVYEGLKFQGEVYELVNTQSVPITLQEQTFYKAGTKAISLESLTVAPHAKMKVIRVLSDA